MDNNKADALSELSHNLTMDIVRRTGLDYREAQRRLLQEVGDTGDKEANQTFQLISFNGSLYSN